MSRPERPTNRRTLSFEDLEAKASLTHVFGGSGMLTSEAAALFGDANNIRSISDARVGLLLRYVAVLESTEVERALPTTDEANLADDWLVANQPSS